MCIVCLEGGNLLIDHLTYIPTTSRCLMFHRPLLNREKLQVRTRYYLFVHLAGCLPVTMRWCCTCKLAFKIGSAFSLPVQRVYLFPLVQSVVFFVFVVDSCLLCSYKVQEYAVEKPIYAIIYALKIKVFDPDCCASVMYGYK